MSRSSVDKVQIGECTLYCGDCLQVLNCVGAVDMVFADPPYGTTACDWDVRIPFADMWAAIAMVTTKDTPILITATQPFSSELVCSNLGMFKYETVYEKTNAKGFLAASSRPLTAHEIVLLFCEGTPPFYPQKWKVPDYLVTKRKSATTKQSGAVYGSRKLNRWEDTGVRQPTSVIGFSNRVGREGNYHNTQKPVALMEYLVRSYTQPGELVCDFTMGSATTAIACLNTGRRFVGIEKNEEFFERACARVKAWHDKPSLVLEGAHA